MSDKLTGYQINQFKNLLISHLRMFRYDIQKELLSRTNEHFHQLANAVYESADEMLPGLLVDIKLADINPYINKLKDIDSALQRIEKGRFGICTECERPIPFKRLLAYPTAKRCLVCQRLYEKNALDGAVD